MSSDAYKREHYRDVRIRFQKGYYADVLSQAIKASGEEISTYVRKAIEMRMVADGFKKAPAE